MSSTTWMIPPIQCRNREHHPRTCFTKLGPDLSTFENFYKKGTIQLVCNPRLTGAEYKSLQALKRTLWTGPSSVARSCLIGSP